MAAVSSPAERFTGFSDEAIQFFLELQAEQSRAWFKAHQDDFVRLCRRPLELFVNELRERLAADYPGLAEVEPHFFRIQRDTRFARDKAPYKTNVAADLSVRPSGAGDNQHDQPGLYTSFGLDGEFVAIGCWHMSPETLARFRRAVDHPASGPRLHKAVEHLSARGWSIASMESLKRVPPPYAQDHPRAELLKRKGLALMISPDSGISATPAYVDWAVERLREVKPVVDWLDRELR